MLFRSVVVIGVAGVLYAASQKNKNKPTEVRIEAVENRDLVASVTASGQMR